MDLPHDAIPPNPAIIMAGGSAVVTRKKRSTPKTRTGCRTCRQRHIKCDERKPVCLRCEKLGVQCHGLGYYSSTIIPTCAASIWLQKFESPYSKSLAEGLPFDELDMRYFQLFQERSTTDLSGYFQSEFWSRLILQQGQYDPSIKDAIIALGALYKSIEVARNSQPGLEARLNQFKHLESAIQHYQRAVRGQQKVLKTGRLQLRSFLMSCLLFVCFEALQGDHQSALEQISCGLHLLHEYGSTSERSHSLPDGQVDEELPQIFSRLEIHLRIFDDARPEQYVLPNLSKKIQSLTIPYTSSNLHSEKQLHPLIESVEEARYTWDLLYPRIFDIRHRTERYRYYSRKDVPVEFLLEVDRQINELLSWKAAFDPFFQKTWSSQNDTNRPGAATIYINYLLGYHKISTCFELLETGYDSLLWQFQETVRLSRYLLDTGSSPLSEKPTFFLDSVVANPLFITGLKCRDRTLRREANELLKSSNRREGMWDSAMLSWVIDWMIANEEAGVEPDMILPECNRFRMLNIRCDIHKRTGWVRCGRHVDGVEGYVDVREASFIY